METVNDRKTVAHYRIVEEIGRGGMGVVYKAEDTRLGRLVALKCFPPTVLGDAEALRRFAREARATCAVNHPHILTVYDVGQSDEVHYIAAELVVGMTLRELLKQRLEVARSVEIAKQILEALAAAHHEGIVHRDLKPENIMIRADGYVKVLDFGIATLIARSSLANPGGTSSDTLTATGHVIGTLAYMSPEQALGRPTNAASDLFSFGIVFYEMIAGKHPWSHQAAVDTVHGIIHDAMPPLAAASEAFQGLQAILERALRKDPADRYRSAEDMLNDLDRVRARNVEGTLPSPAVVGQRSLAVLPFVFLNQIEERESLSLGFADALITSLGNLEDFLVLPTSAILKYPGGSDPLMVSQELQVQHVLQGNIQRLGPRWRVTLQLYDANARKTVLANKLDFNLEDVFEIQDQICQRVADSLAGKFRSSPAKARDRYSTDPYAYDEYLQGLRGSYSDTPEIMEDALLHLSQAIERDSDFALAHAALARVLVDKHRIFDPRRSIGEQAEYHAERALELDPDLSEGHLARACVLWSQIKKYQGYEALAELLKAQALQPNLDGLQSQLGLICCHYGRMAESLEAFETARRTNPQNMWARWAGLVHLWSGHFEKAIPEAEGWMHASPGTKYALWLRSHPLLLTGDLKTAEKYLGQALAMAPDEPLYLSLQGILHALKGETELALQCIRRTCESPYSFGHDHHTYYQLGSIYSVLGETQKSLGWINRSIETGFPCWTFFQVDPTLKNLRTLPEFQTQVEELKQQSRKIRTSKPLLSETGLSPS